MLPMAVNLAITNHSVSENPFDDINSCDIMYLSIFSGSGLHRRDLKPYEGWDLMAFKNSYAHPSRIVQLPVYVEKRKDKEIVITSYYCKINKLPYTYK